MSEAELLRHIQLAVSAAGARLFRNQVGQYRLPDGRVLRSGLAVGSSDLIGWTPALVTPDMVGSVVAVFSAVEVKSQTGRPTPEQVTFLDCVGRAGGIAVLARSVDDVLVAMKRG